MKLHYTIENELVEKTYQFLQEFETSDLISVQTSGSTGAKKNYQVEKGKFLLSAKRTNKFFKLKKGDKAFLCLSPEYIGGKMMIVRALLAELDLHIGNASSFPFEEKQEFDFAAFVPLQIKSILNQDINRLKAIRNIIIGGGELSLEIENELLKNKINAYATFGMTETLSHIALRKIGEKEYHLLDGIEISLDELGRLSIHDEKITGKPILKTNDIVQITSPSSFIWRGRWDNVINSGGIKLYPEEIEAKLSSIIPFNFFISKMKDAHFGEKVILILESESELNIDFNNYLTKYEIPKTIFHLKQFEYTDTSKINRNKTLAKLNFEK